MIDESFRKVTNNTLIESECIDRSLINLTAQDTKSNESSSFQARNSFPSLERLLLDALGVRKSSLIKLNVSR